MSIPYNAIGYNGQQVRNEIQSAFDKIEQTLLDPVWVRNNNKASKADRDAGVLIFEWKFEGQLNQVEISTLESDWISPPNNWTEATVTNNETTPHNTPDKLQWTFRLEYRP